MKPKQVVLVQDTGHEYDKAEKFGKVLPYIIGPVNIFSNIRLVDLIAWLDANFNKGDYLLMTGSLFLNCIAFNHITKKFGEINVLVFHNGEQTYRSMTVKNNMIGGNND